MNSSIFCRFFSGLSRPGTIFSHHYRSSTQAVAKRSQQLLQKYVPIDSRRFVDHTHEPHVVKQRISFCIDNIALISLFGIFYVLSYTKNSFFLYFRNWSKCNHKTTKKLKMSQRNASGSSVFHSSLNLWPLDVTQVNLMTKITPNNCTRANRLF